MERLGQGEAEAEFCRDVLGGTTGKTGVTFV